MSEDLIPSFLETIGSLHAQLNFRYANERVTAHNREELLRLCKSIANETHTLGKLLENAANGRGPAACNATPLKLTEPVDTLTFGDTAPLAMIGESSGGDA